MKRQSCWSRFFRCQILSGVFYYFLASTYAALHISNAHTTQSTDIPSTNENIISPETTMAAPPPEHTIKCLSTRNKLFKFGLSTHRNGTGHWLADMDMQHGEGTKATSKYPFEIILEHKSKTCLTCQEQEPVDVHVTIQEPPPIATPKSGGYHYIPGFGFYKRHQQKLNWHAARNVCVSEGADLVVVNSEAEAKILLELSAPLMLRTDSDHWNAEAFIGAYDIHKQGHFTTVTGQTLEETGYVHWSLEEPTSSKEADCVIFMKNGEYAVFTCNKKLEFICEIPEL